MGQACAIESCGNSPTDILNNIGESGGEGRGGGAGSLSGKKSDGVGGRNNGAVVTLTASGALIIRSNVDHWWVEDVVDRLSERDIANYWVR